MSRCHSSFVRAAFAILVSLLTVAAGLAQTPEFPIIETASHRFEEVAPGVHFVSEVGPVFLMSNAMVVINADDVLVVDSHVTPGAARALVASIATLTPKPIRTVVNTHYHFDHAHGNQVFGPGVEIIGHEFTRQKLSGKPLEESTFRSFNQIFPQRLAALRESLAAASDAAEKSRLETQVKAIAAHIESTKEIVPTPPTVTLASKMTLHRGGREIQLHFLGRGHTGGDVVVLLPAERVMFTGDLLLPRLSYMGDGHVDEWGATLERVKSLPADLIVPGHGRPFRDKTTIDRLQAYYQDLWREAKTLEEQGLSAEEAALRVNLTRHGKLGVTQPGVDVRAVQRIYELLSAGS